MEGKNNPYDVDKVASEISESEKFEHVKRGREKWEKLHGVKDREGYRKFIKETITSEDTKSFKAANNRDLYYNEKTNIFVIVNYDPNSKSKGNCFKPTGGIKNFLRDLEDDKKRRKGLDMPPPEIKKGGFEQLYPDAKKIEISEAQRKRDEFEERERKHKERLQQRGRNGREI